MRKLLTVCVILILSLTLLSCKSNGMSEKEKQSMIAEYLISPDRKPSEVFDFIKEQYGDDYMKVIKEWNLESYYEKVQLDNK